jgi:hypothetical protein
VTTVFAGTVTTAAGCRNVVVVTTLRVVVGVTILGAVFTLNVVLVVCEELIWSPTSCWEATVVGAALSPETPDDELSRATEATGTIANVPIRIERWNARLETVLRSPPFLGDMVAARTTPPSYARQRQPRRQPSNLSVSEIPDKDGA